MYRESKIEGGYIEAPERATPLPTNTNFRCTRVPHVRGLVIPSWYKNEDHVHSLPSCESRKLDDKGKGRGGWHAFGL